MSHPLLALYQTKLTSQQSSVNKSREQEKLHRFSFAPSHLAEFITREASSQTYFTIRYLVDRPLIANAYRAYAYFRWVDDVVDQEQTSQAARLDFLARQQEIIARCCQGDWPLDLCPEEKLVADLIHGSQATNKGLRTYIEQMMAVMVFDAERKGRFISQAELDEYTKALATAVTEALHTFIGHHDWSPQDETRYFAVTGAHIIHMLRDAIEDTAVGYYNIPCEYLNQHNLIPTDVNHEAYRAWVRQRVHLARRYFALGRTYLARVENLRCRLTGYAYIARFEVVLDAIEKDDYHLRAAYPERKSAKSGFKVGLTALKQTVASSMQQTGRSSSKSWREEMP
ncbi:MAG: squalene/phytoene synthase family protein [Anaerolineaceae bacterium]|nr:squalene/phytoene synthase family protein [Anaerolineaceae bacterium]